MPILQHHFLTVSTFYKFLYSCLIKNSQNIKDAQIKTKTKYFISKQAASVEPQAGDSAEIKVAKKVVKQQGSKKKKFKLKTRAQKYSALAILL